MSEAAALGPEQEHVEDVTCDFNPEAEPEVEIGTEADLAEADQSPGQQGPGVGDSVPVPDNWSLDHEIVLHRNSGTIFLLNGDEPRDINDTSESASVIQMCSDACTDQEAVLDDIPIKLCPSEEDLSQQLKEEQPIELPCDEDTYEGEFAADNVEDIGLATLR